MSSFVITVLLLCSFVLIFVSVIEAGENVTETDRSFDQMNSQFLESILGTKVTIKPGRHVCMTEKIVSRPVQLSQTYKSPVYISHPRDCTDFNNCPQFDVSYETKNRTVFKLQKYSTFRHSCCPGWTQGQRREKGCMAPICTNGCGEFGVCAKPEMCQCRTGFSGEMCDTDIDECRQDKHNCQQICKNTAGSFICACQDGFTLAADGKTCNYCYTCQKEYTGLVTSVQEMKNQFMNRIEFQKEQVDVMKVQNDSASDKIQVLEDKVRQLEEENNVQSEIINSLNESYAKAMDSMKQDHADILEKQEEQTEIMNLQSDSIRETIEGLDEKIRDLTEQNVQLQDTLGEVLNKYNETLVEIEKMKDSFKTTEQSTAVPQPPATSTRPKPQGGLQFGVEDIIYSLSNQIGLLEEKLELCNCVPRRYP